MIPDRYPAPAATRIFNDVYKYALWKEITDAYAIEAISDAGLSDEQAEYLERNLYETNPPTPEMVAEFEEEHGHDVVAFLAAYTTKLDGLARKYIHDGLTSSDLVDYGLFQSVREHSAAMVSLLSTLRRLLQNQPSAIRPGRTHGQIADHTTWFHQVAVTEGVLAEIGTSLSDWSDFTVLKSPGPTGWPGAWPEVDVRAKAVADRLSADYTLGTQVIHRDRLLAWACFYVRLAASLENLALLVRAGARSGVDEIREGASRTGSSSMPHKRNPIDSEKVCGLARVARGHFASLAENVALWDDRDISNSSVERIAVPGLAATVEHMTITMLKVMQHLRVDKERMEGSATNPQCFTNIWQVAIQRTYGLGPIQSAEVVRVAIATYPNYPGAWQMAVSDALAGRGFDPEPWAEMVEREVSVRFES